MTAMQKSAPGAGSKLFPDNQAVYRALSDSQFVPFFQPLLTLRTGQLASFEVLARWRHPTEGMIPPDRFIPMAERDGWIGELMRQILKKALRAAAAIPGTFTVAFNVSPLQLRDITLPDQIREISQEADFPLSRLIVEITESALIEHLNEATLVVAELKEMGCKLALDDFGTGYSSLSHLQSLPFDELKVDRSFVSSMMTDRGSRKIVSAVVGLGQSLGLATVAEGIETQEQAEMMIWLGCELGQGYLFGRPMPVEELAASIASRRPALVPDSQSICKGISRKNLETSPSQRLAQLQAVYDGTPVGLGFIDQNLRFVNLNKKLAEINGGSVESHLGAHVSDAIPEMFPYLEPYLKRALRGEIIVDIEVINPVSGETRLINYQPALDEAGEVVGIAIAVSQIADRDQLEQAFSLEQAAYKGTPAGDSQNFRPLNAPSRDSGIRVSVTRVSEESTLKPYEATALSAIARCSSTKGIILTDLAREMHKVGLVQATSLAVNSLRRRNFIVRVGIPTGARQDSTRVAGLMLTPAGQQWIIENPQPVAKSTINFQHPTEDSSLINVLSTLRFRS